MGKHDIEENKKSKSVNKKSKTRRINNFGIFVLAIILCAAIVAGYFAPQISNTINKLGGGKQGILAMMLGHTEETLKNLDKVNIVLIGESGVDEWKLADTIMICSYDPKTQKAAIMSVPRDTFVGTNKNRARGEDKINSRYLSGTRTDILLSDLEKITGLELDYYIRINTDALIKLVDLIGGVEFDVPMDMKYDDYTQNLHINLKKGRQHINGAKAEQLLRFRHSNNGTTYSTDYGQEDFGRMRTQREFIMATLSQTLQTKNLDKLDELINIGYKNLVTNVDIDKMIDYLPYIVNFNVENLKMDYLPGESEQCNGVWIYTHDKQKTKEMIQDLFLDDETVEDGETQDN